MAINDNLLADDDIGRNHFQPLTPRSKEASKRQR
jgi:hypothetical protein